MESTLLKDVFVTAALAAGADVAVGMWTIRIEAMGWEPIP